MFQNNQDFPAMYAGVTWTVSPRTAAGACHSCLDCAVAFNNMTCVQNRILPLEGTGLAYQHRCRGLFRTSEAVSEFVNAYTHEQDGHLMRMKCSGEDI